MKKVIIIGNGIAGITAARHIRKRSEYHITVISSESDHFWSRTALMYIYMGHMRYEHTKPYEDHFWKKNNIALVRAHVTKINTADKSIETDASQKLSYDKLIIATGSKPNKFGWEGEDLDGVTGMVSLQDLDRIESYTKNIHRGVIVGGGLIGIELAEMLRSRNIPVTLLVREPCFWGNVLPREEGAMISSHISSHGVDLRLNTELSRIIPDGKGRVQAVITSAGEEIKCEFVGLAAGVHANLNLCSGTPIETSRGILVDKNLETSVPDIFAIGDCAELRESLPGRKSIEQVWYVGRMMGETVARTITGKTTPYTPGPWFNSAKFFDIEYQTYGSVLPACPDDEHDFFWRSPAKDVAIHLRFKKNTHTFTGINTFGIRMRHNKFDAWLQHGATIEKVINGLEAANFDPEFSRNYSDEIRNAFRGEFSNIDVRVGAAKRTLGIFGI